MNARCARSLAVSLQVPDPMPSTLPATPSFEALGLNAPLLAGLRETGYEAPTAIQGRTIPVLLAGRDLVGQAQTGTGKTAAFALPILQKLDPGRPHVQALVLVPTRELAIQVAEAIHTYARHLPGVRVLPVYGGQPIHRQLQRLRRGVHVVVGTPGRVLDHLRRGTLNLAQLAFVVLDEGDEMLRMGFIDDVEEILGQVPGTRQTALFSATMPREIRRIADRHLHDPVTVQIEAQALTVPSVRQRYLHVSEPRKLDTLTRILEVEPTEGVLVFVRTKTGAADLTERLQARGWAAEALHGDMNQAQREQVVRRLRQGQVEIVVATDVAARGLDVERLSHVVNYDVPYDPESYVHRIGRTARAGRAGTAVLFVTPREGRLLKLIERFAGRRIEPMKVPTVAEVTARRTAMFKERLRTAAAAEDLAPYLTLVQELADEAGLEMIEVAAAAARLARGEQPLEAVVEREGDGHEGGESGRVRLVIDAGRRDGLRPADVVGAIANEADLPGRAIGPIEIHDRVTFVDIPARHRDQVLSRMAGVVIRSRPVQVRVAVPASEDAAGRGRPRPSGRRLPARASPARRSRRASRR